MIQPIQSVIGAIFSPDRSKVLLIKRRDVPVWVLPGGGVEPSESPEEAMLREIVEETGFRVKVKRKVGLYLPINRLSRTTALYECEIVEGCARISSETKDIQFFPVSDLPRLIPPPFPEWIHDALSTQDPVHKYLTSVNYRSLFFYSLTHPLLVIRFLLSRLNIPFNH